MRIGFIPSYTERVYAVGDNTGSSVLYIPLGDSLSAGVGVPTYQQSFPYLVAEHLHEKRGVQVLLKPHAIPGATTDDAMAELLDKVVASQPNIVTILLGVNDVHIGVSPTTFRQNYEMILQRLIRDTHAILYIINIPYIGASDLTSPAESARLDGRTREFNVILQGLAQTYHIEYIDLYAPTLLPSQQDEYYSADRFHPSQAGYKVWAHILYDHID
jgi:lysophospholipase L1-like esterase